MGGAQSPGFVTRVTWQRAAAQAKRAQNWRSEIKLVTFVANSVERFGIVLSHPTSAEFWVFDPEETEARLHRYASNVTSPFNATRPRFLEQRPWPRALSGFLALGDSGMSAARNLHDVLLRFLEQNDQALMIGAGFPLSRVRLRAPIPRPRLYFGLVQNNPSFWCNDLARPVVNVYPQGHQRPQGTVVGAGEAVVIPEEMNGFGWTPELGVIIGRTGKEIEVGQALEYVAGYTVVLDIAHPDYMNRIRDAADTPLDWFEEATGSWLGKKSDTMCPMGPFLTTADEVGSAYNLMIFTRQSGWQRDCAHTGAMLVGIERAVSWLSSFLTLYPGDVIHMGTMGVDGMAFTEDLCFGADDYLEGEIERVGRLRVPVVVAGRDDWRPCDDPGRRIHPVPAARDLIEAGTESIVDAQAWDPCGTRHFWTVYGNYRGAQGVEGLALRPLPRVLNCPSGSLEPVGRPLRIPARARGLALGVELALVIRQATLQVTVECAADYVLGYVVLAVVHDDSFTQPIREPTIPQERSLPAVYARWGDGFNVVSKPPVSLEPLALRGRTMLLALDPVGELVTSTDEYVLMAPEVLSFLTRHITLFPGDVVTFGRTRDLLTLPAETRLPKNATLCASIEGIGSVTCPVVDLRSGTTGG